MLLPLKDGGGIYLVKRRSRSSTGSWRSQSSEAASSRWPVSSGGSEPSRSELTLARHHDWLASEQARELPKPIEQPLASKRGQGRIELEHQPAVLDPQRRPREDSRHGG